MSIENPRKRAAALDAAALFQLLLSLVKFAGGCVEQILIIHILGIAFSIEPAIIFLIEIRQLAGDLRLIRHTVACAKHAGGRVPCAGDLPQRKALIARFDQNHLLYSPIG